MSPHGLTLPTRSAPVRTSITPGIRRAADVSTDLIRAWATSLRKILAYSMPGSLMSSMKRAVPVSRARSSLRGTDWPTSLRWSC